MSSVALRHSVHRIPNAVLTWAGFCPWTGTYCFGSEDGRVGISPGRWRGAWKNATNWTANVKVTTAPVNGIAFLGQYAAVSCRHEIIVLRQSKVSKTHFRPDPVLTHEYGAHGVLAVKAINEIIAPVGGGGMVRISMSQTGESSARTIQAKDRKLNFYRFACGVEEGGRALIASACRSGGIAAFWLAKSGPPSAIARHVFGKGDIVDVVPVNDPRTPRGVIGLSKDGALVWIADVLSSEPPRTLSPKVGIDTAYALLVVKGNGLVLADETLSCLPDLVEGFITQRESMDAFTLPLDGEELLPSPQNSFFLLSEGEPREFDVSLLIEDAKALQTAIAQAPVPPSNRPDFREIIQTEVTRDGYVPHELDWSREEDSLFVPEFA